MSVVSPFMADDESGDAAIIDNRMLPDQVATILVRGVLFGRLQPGQRINEAELARTLGISRNPIREAIRRLEERGLLVAVPRKGTFVRTLRKEDIDDLFSFRKLIERYAMEQAIRHITPADVDRLSNHVQTMVDAAKSGDERTLVELDLAFHQEFCKLSRSPLTLRTFNNMQAEVQLLITMSERKFESLIAAASDHWLIIEAIRTGEPDKAINAISDHIDVAWAHLNS